MGRKSIAGERRTQIIEAFYRCVVRHGQAWASIRKIADEAGVQPSTLHHYFKSRDEIMEEAVIYFTDMIFKDFHDQMKAWEDAPDPVTKGIEFIFSKGMINVDYTGFFLECCVAARNNERIKNAIAQLFDRFRRAILDHLDGMGGFSHLSETNRRMLSAIIVAIHEGIELQWFADQGAVRLDHAREATQQVIRFFMEEKKQEEEQG